MNITRPQCIYEACPGHVTRTKVEPVPGTQIGQQNYRCSKCGARWVNWLTPTSTKLLVRSHNRELFRNLGGRPLKTDESISVGQEEYQRRTQRLKRESDGRMYRKWEKWDTKLSDHSAALESLPVTSGQEDFETASQRRIRLDRELAERNARRLREDGEQRRRRLDREIYLRQMRTEATKVGVEFKTCETCEFEPANRDCIHCDGKGYYGPKLTYRGEPIETGRETVYTQEAIDALTDLVEKQSKILRRVVRDANARRRRGEI